MIRIGSVLPSRAIEVPACELEEMAYLFGVDIETPGNRAGWAYATVAGHRYRAWVLAPGAEVAS